MHRFHQAMAKAVEGALKRLLSDKHLYQFVEPDLTFIVPTAVAVQSEIRVSPRIHAPGAARRPSVDDVAKTGGAVLRLCWMPVMRTAPSETTMIPTFGPSGNAVQFQLPTINTFCTHCDNAWPFNPMLNGSYCVSDDDQSQSYFLSYQCQDCKSRPIRFLVRREGIRLRLCGRDPLEVLPIPKVLPKAPGKYYSDACIAHHAGQTLAGLFLLRVLIEQYWQTASAVRELVAKNPRATGEEQGTEYQKRLPEDFKSRFPSLKEVYGKLSAAMHSAEANAELFEESCGQIVEHFEARRLFKIP